MNELPTNQPHGWMWMEGFDTNHAEWAAWVAVSDEMKRWYRAEIFQCHPSRQEIHDQGPEMALSGWKPARPIIFPNTRVLAMGSCFAANYAEWLARNGYNQSFAQASRALLRNPFENIAVIAQQFRWAFGEVDPERLLWIGKDKERILATEERRLALRQSLLDAEVMVITLALSEIWYDKTTQEPLWRIATMETHDPNRHAFKVLSFGETIDAFNQIERIRSQWLPGLRIIYTVSPLNMAATFRPVSVLTANAASKAIVRGALDEFLRSRPDDLNKVYFYYPSYEIVTGLLKNPFKPDNFHLHDYAIDLVLDVFSRAFAAERTNSAPLGGTPAWRSAVEGSTQLAELAMHNAELQKVCDERLSGMHELTAICEERLAVINQLVERPVEEPGEKPLEELSAGTLARMLARKIFTRSAVRPSSGRSPSN